MCSVFMCCATGSSDSAWRFSSTASSDFGDERGVAELADVAREQRGDELALAEDADEPLVGVDDREGGQPGVDDRRDGLADRLVGPSSGNLAVDERRRSCAAHQAYLSRM